MSDQRTRHGRREVRREEGALSRWRRQYRGWLKGMTRGQRIRYRLLQAATILAIIIIGVFIWLRAWIRLPDIPDLPGFGGGQTVIGEDGVAFDGAQLPDVVNSGRKPGYYTFLVAGRDVASGATDTILLFTFDTENKVLKALSIPRDTMINTSASSKRINTVYARNRGSSDLPEKERVEKGMTALKQEVSKLTGIYPDFYVLLEWDAVGELVDALDGVYFDVPFDMNYDDPAQDLHIHQEAGYRLLDGEDAMEVVRWRKNNTGSSGGDVARIQVQQAFLSAVLNKCLQPTTLLKAPTLAQIFLDNVSTDLSIGNILAFAELAVGMDPENDVSFNTMPYANAPYNGASMVTAVESELLPILNDGLNPYQDEIQSSDLQLMYKKSGGGYGVTNATLADAAMGRVPVVTQPEEEEEEEGEVPIEPEDPAQGGEGTGTEQPGDGTQGTQEDGSQGNQGDVTQPEDPTQNGGGNGTGQTGDGSQGSQGGGSHPQDPGQGGTSQGQTGTGTDPEQVLPDPDPPVSQDIHAKARGEEDSQVLPSWPTPQKVA